VYPSQGRVWLAMAAMCLVCSSCNQPPQKTTLGNLPGPAASDLEPKVNATTYFAHGHLLERQGQFERAVVQYRKAVALQPDFLSARNRLGITLNKLGRHAEATAQFEQAVASHPGLAYLHNNLGFSLYLEGEYGKAEAALEQALSLQSDFSRAHFNRALVLARLERFDDAFSELMQAGGEPDACFNMGILLTEAEQYAAAARYLESALALKPDFDAAQQQLREVSRLAAEVETQQAVQPALAAETVAPSPSPGPTETLVSDASTAEPASVAEGVVVADAPAEPTVTELPMTDVGDADAASPPQPAEPATNASIETTGELQPDGQTTAEDATTEPAIPTVADALIENKIPEAATTLVADVVIPADEGPAEISPSLIVTTDAGGPGWAHEPDVDPEVLLALINDALAALKNQSPDFEMLWCQLNYYLFPETAPNQPDSASETTREGPGAFPENVPEEWILDWPD
jgi:Flp pilus assembly protein TadD